jgi:hypothetical protein
MKKILCILFVLLLAAGCSSKNHYSYVSEGDEVLISGPNKYSYTKNDLYASLKKASEGAITNEILTRIARNIEGIDLDSIYADADNLIETYVSMGYESYIVASYGSLEAYRQSYISSLILSELSKQYARENYDTLVADKKPVKMQIATFENLEDAEKCIEDVKNGSTFDMAAVNNNAANAPQSAVYTDDDASLAYEVKEYLNSTENTGLSTILVSTASSTDENGNAVDVNTYYLLNVESRNTEDFTEELIELLASSVSTDTVKEYFLSTHDIKFYDQDLYEMMSAAYEVLK